MSEIENDYLKASTLPADMAKRWERPILDTRSCGDFTRQYFGELSRLRFMDEYWPCEMKDAAMNLNGKQMLVLSQLQTRVRFTIDLKGKKINNANSSGLSFN